MSFFSIAWHRVTVQKMITIVKIIIIIMATIIVSSHKYFWNEYVEVGKWAKKGL